MQGGPIRQSYIDTRVLLTAVLASTNISQERYKRFDAAAGLTVQLILNHSATALYRRLMATKPLRLPPAYAMERLAWL